MITSEHATQLNELMQKIEFRCKAFIIYGPVKDHRINVFSRINSSQNKSENIK